MGDAAGDIRGQCMAYIKDMTYALAVHGVLAFQ